MTRLRSTQSLNGSSREDLPFLDLSGESGLNVSLVVPPDGSCHHAAKRIARAILNRFGVDAPLLPGDRKPDAGPTGHAIALGCLANNPFVETLYLRWNTLVDRWYPGPGGWVLQLIPSPLERGHHVQLVGSSDAQGMMIAADRLVSRIRTTEAGGIPWHLEVELGEGHLPLPADRIDSLGTAASDISIPESALPDTPCPSGYEGGSKRNHLLRLGMYGPHADNFHFSRSSQYGLRYLYTGMLADAGTYRRTLLSEVRLGVIGKLYHYKSLRMFQLWSLLRPCPVFSGEERGEIDEALHDYLLKESGVANSDEIQKDTVTTRIFSRHVACDALNLWVGTDWLWRRTGEPGWLDWRSVADAYFEAQRGTDVPLTGLTEGYASYLDVYLEWMLLSCPSRIAKDDHVRLWAERLLLLCTNTGQLVLGPQTDENRYPYNLLRRLAYFLKDGRFLYASNLREIQVGRGVDRVVQFSAGQAYSGEVEACEPDGIGLTTTPLNERLRLWKAPSIAPDLGFDRAVARGGWKEDDEYLMIIGVRGGGKSLPNVGSVAAYERFGQRLITSDSVPLFPDSANPWRVSTIAVNLGGSGPGLAEGVEQLSCERMAGGHALSFRVVAGDHHQWVRQVFWMPSGFVLVIDRVKVLRNETFTLGSNWRCANPVESLDGRLATLRLGDGMDGRFFVEVSPNLILGAETQTYPALGSPSICPSSTEVMLHAAMTQVASERDVVVATLLHAVTGSLLPRYRLRNQGEDWIVGSPAEELHFRGDASGRLEVTRLAAPDRSIGGVGTPTRTTVSAPSDSPGGLTTLWSSELAGTVSTWTQAVDGSAVVLGLQSGEVVLLDGDGRVKWRTDGPATVSAISLTASGIYVGTVSGLVSRIDRQTGTVLWRFACTFRQERLYWPWWFLETPLIGALAVGQDAGHGREIVAAGTGSANLVFLDGSSGELMEDVLSPYGLPDRIQAHHSVDSGHLQFLTGHSRLTCGSTVRAWDVWPGARVATEFEKSVDPMGRCTDGWDNCGVVDFHAGALAEDGPDTVVVLRQGTVNQITAYKKATGQPLWDGTLGGPPVALRVLSGQSVATARCYVAEQFGWLVGFDGAGNKVSATHFAQSLRNMHACPTGDLVLWNLDELQIAREDRPTQRYRLDGNPLGWYAHPKNPGLLCLDRGRIVLRGVR